MKNKSYLILLLVLNLMACNKEYKAGKNWLEIGISHNWKEVIIRMAN
jgi:hypothetical protein